VKNFKHVFLTFFLALVACAPSPDKRFEQKREKVDSLFIYRPALNFTGDKLVFDFNEALSNRHRSAYAIGLFDLNDETIDIWVHPNPSVEWYSASFSPEDKIVTMITRCLREE
jgi:hypothetical protein